MMSILDYFDYLNNIVVWSVVAVFAAAGAAADGPDSSGPRKG